MEDHHKLLALSQQKLNPNINKVVKTEVMKLFDACIIYLISNNAWVSPVQVIPKKGEMTLTTNEKNELIPTRTIIGC